MIQPAPLPIRYYREGHPRLSVTQILGLAGRIDRQWFTPEAAERGECVHYYCEQIDRGHDPHPLPADWQGYAEAYLSFLYTVKPVWAVDGIEREVYHPVWQIAGRIDRIATDIFGHPGILDIKTGSKSPWHAHQLAAYNVMHPTGTRWALYLSVSGRYQLRRHTEVYAYREFLYDVARWRGTVTARGDYWVPRTEGDGDGEEAGRADGGAHGRGGPARPTDD